MSGIVKHLSQTYVNPGKKTDPHLLPQRIYFFFYIFFFKLLFPLFISNRLLFFIFLFFSQFFYSSRCNIFISIRYVVNILLLENTEYNYFFWSFKNIN